MIRMMWLPGQQDWCPGRGLSHCCAAIPEEELDPDNGCHHQSDDGCHDKDNTHTAIFAALTTPSRVWARHRRFPPASSLSASWWSIVIMAIIEVMVNIITTTITTSARLTCCSHHRQTWRPAAGSTRAEPEHWRCWIIIVITISFIIMVDIIIIVIIIVFIIMVIVIIMMIITIHLIICSHLSRLSIRANPTPRDCWFVSRRILVDTTLSS